MYACKSGVSFEKLICYAQFEPYTVVIMVSPGLLSFPNTDFEVPRAGFRASGRNSGGVFGVTPENADSSSSPSEIV